MKSNLNLIEDQLKNNDEINIYSVKGFKWREKELPKNSAITLSNQLNIDLYLAKIAIARGLDSSNLEKYMYPKIKTSIPDPNVLDDMKKATKKVLEYIQNNKKIGILGDYDVDGSSATALLINYFKDIGVDYEYYIPDRIREGYGPNLEAFRFLNRKGCDLVLTVDCGTTAVKSIEKINQEGMEIIIIDHHLESNSLPNAFAIINPKKKSDNSNLENLCATGVVFFFMISINRELKKFKKYNLNLPNLIKYLDLVALATVCDLVKLDQVNRAFVKQGIRVLNKTVNSGIVSLLKDSSINQEINEYHLGFVIGPRINAGGRVGNARLGVNLLTEKNIDISKILSKKLCDYNNLRKIIEKKVENEAIKQVLVDDNIICVNNKDWHPGVIGIVAARLTEKYNRPTIVISEGDQLCAASCRSVKSFDIGKLIHDSVQGGLLISGGGHKMAGGFTLKKNQISEFKNFIKHKFKKKDKDLEKNYDSELSLSLIDNKMYDKLNKFSPFGIGNPRPKFLIKDCFIKYPKLVGGKHYSFTIEDVYSNRIKCISFNSLGSSLSKVIEKKSFVKGMIVAITLNDWGGRQNTELILEDILI